MALDPAINDIYITLTLEGGEELVFAYDGTSSYGDFQRVNINGRDTTWRLGFDTVNDVRITAFVEARGYTHLGSLIPAESAYRNLFWDYTVTVPSWMLIAGASNEELEEIRRTDNGDGTTTFTIVDRDDFKHYSFPVQTLFNEFAARNVHALSGSEALVWTFVLGYKGTGLEEVYVPDSGGRDHAFLKFMGLHDGHDGVSAKFDTWRSLFSAGPNSENPSLTGFGQDFKWYCLWGQTIPSLASGGVVPLRGVWRLWSSLCGNDDGKRAGDQQRYTPIHSLLVNAVIDGDMESFDFAMKLGRNLVARCFVLDSPYSDPNGGAERHLFNYTGMRRVEKSFGYRQGDGHNAQPEPSHAWFADLVWLSKFTDDPMIQRAATVVMDRMKGPWLGYPGQTYEVDVNKTFFYWHWLGGQQPRISDRYLEGLLACFLATGDSSYMDAARDCITYIMSEATTNTPVGDLWFFKTTLNRDAPWVDQHLLFRIQQWMDLGIETTSPSQWAPTMEKLYRTGFEYLLDKTWIYVGNQYVSVPLDPPLPAVNQRFGSWGMERNVEYRSRSIHSTGDHLNGIYPMLFIHSSYVFAKAYDVHYRGLVRQILDELLASWDALPTIEHVHYPVSQDNVTKTGGQFVWGYRPHILREILTWSPDSVVHGPLGTPPSNYGNAGLFSEASPSASLSGQCEMTAILSNVTYVPTFVDGSVTLVGSVTSRQSLTILPVVTGQAEMFASASIAATLSEVGYVPGILEGAWAGVASCSMMVGLTLSSSSGTVPVPGASHPSEFQFPGCRQSHETHQLQILPPG